MPLGFVTRSWRIHRQILANAASLVATTGFTSALGFVFWAVATRLFTPATVGYGSAALSAMSLIASIGMFGLGTLLIGELPRRSSRAGLISAALILAAGTSCVLALAFAFAAPHLSSRLDGIGGTTERAAIFVGGAALTSAATVFDQATIGLLRGGIQLARNVAFAIAKLLLLPLAAVAVGQVLGVPLEIAWIVGLALSLGGILIWLAVKRFPVFARPDWRIMRSLGRSALAHSWLNLAFAVPQSVIPVLVTVLISPSANAAFYVAWMIAGFLYIIPGHLAIVLFAVGSMGPQAVAKKFRFTLRLSLIIGFPGMLILAFAVPIGLRVMGAAYAGPDAIPLLLLALGYIPYIPKVHYLAVGRIRQQISRTAAVVTAGTAGEIALAALGAKLAGLNGLSFGLVVAYLIEALIMGPAVLQVAIGRGRHRKGVLVTDQGTV